MKALVLRILGIAGDVWNFYAPLLRNLFAGAAQALLPVALDIVRSLADADISSAQKREMAVARLRDAAVDYGVDASEAFIRFTVESAVQRMRAEADL